MLRKKPSLIVFDKIMPFSNWLKENRPSMISKNDVAWISVSGTVNDLPTPNLDLISKNYINCNTSKKNILKQIDELALASNLLTGKWLIFVPTMRIDSIWSGIATDVHEGSLGVSCKVSPNEGTGNSHVICVYTTNYQDLNDVMNARNVLRTKHGIESVLTYKPDIYTTLGIYKGNSLGLEPSLYRL
ncbi:translation initiation factor eIF 4e-like domain-containing protein [Globomyces pollinis-pini]|nr:translation initiation factor eIF 4e-like domain-containing protein [Globomyces pollinis-pini]